MFGDKKKGAFNHQQNSLFLLQTPQLSHLFASLYSLGRLLDSVQG